MCEAEQRLIVVTQGGSIRHVIPSIFKPQCVKGEESKIKTKFLTFWPSL